MSVPCTNLKQEPREDKSYKEVDGSIWIEFLVIFSWNRKRNGFPETPAKKQKHSITKQNGFPLKVLAVMSKRTYFKPCQAKGSVGKVTSLFKNIFCRAPIYFFPSASISNKGRKVCNRSRELCFRKTDEKKNVPVGVTHFLMPLKFFDESFRRWDPPSSNYAWTLGKLA